MEMRAGESDEVHFSPERAVASALLRGGRRSILEPSEAPAVMGS